MADVAGVCAHCGRPILRYSEKHVWRHRGQDPDRRDVMGNVENPRRCELDANGGLLPNAEPMTERTLLADLREAADLLLGAAPRTIDPGLRRSWGQRRRRLLERIEAMGADRG